MLRVLVIVLLLGVVAVWIHQETYGDHAVLRKYLLVTAASFLAAVASFVQWVVDDGLTVEGLIALVLLAMSGAMYLLMLCLHKLGWFHEFDARPY